MSLPTLDPAEFETLRSTLVSTYNSQTTAHVGYIIAFAIGIAAILYQIDFKTFFKDYPSKKQRYPLFYVPLSGLIGGIVFLFYRVIFWAYMSTYVLRVPATQVAALLAAYASDPTVTEIYAIQLSCTQKFVGTHSLASTFYSFASNSLLDSTLLFLGFSIIAFLITLLLDYILYKKKDTPVKKNNN